MINDDNFEYHYRGFGIHNSRCNIYFRTIDDVLHILFEDVGIGTSVTNASEQLASEMVNRFDLNPNKCKFFETYSQYNYESIDEIEYTWSSETKNNKIVWIASNPKWNRVDIKHLKHFINLY